MATGTQTTTQREQAGERAAATRRRNAAKRSASQTKSSARQTRTAARTTARSARTTASQASRTAGRRAEAASYSLESLIKQAQRTLVHIPVGAALEARDNAVKTVRTYTDRKSAQTRFNRFERRGEKALRRH
jgi:guanyl-specific ribonuclease Sa